MNKRHYEHTLPNIRGSLSNTYVVSLIVRNIISSFLDSLLFYVAKIVKGNDLQLIRITD